MQDPANSPSGGAPPLPTSSPRATRWATRIIFSVVGLFLLAQPILWFWDSPFGPALPNMIVESMAIVAFILLTLWALIWSEWERDSRIAFGLGIVTLIAGLVGSIRKVELSGDFTFLIEYRWEPTAAERLAAHRAANSAPALDRSAVGAPLPKATAEDMPAYRGARRDGVVVGPDVRTTWEVPPQPLWSHPIGGGYASMAIVGDRLVTIEQREQNEAVVCYRASTGQELWSHGYPASFSALGGPGPRATPTIDGERVFSQGAAGDLICLDLATGSVHWSHNLMRQWGVPNSTWGFTSSPLVIENRVIANAGGIAGDGLVAYNKTTGELLWKGAGLTTGSVPQPTTPTEVSHPVLTTSPDEDHPAPAPGSTSLTGYCSPVLETLHGVPQIINFDGAALRGQDIATGRTLWSLPYRNGPAVNVAQPIVFEDGRIFISASYDVGSAMLQVSLDGDQWSVKRIWKSEKMRCKFTSPILCDGFLYGLDEGILVCLDPQTGERQWKAGRYRHGQLLLTNGVLIVQTESGQIVFVRPNPEKLEELGSFQALPDDDKCWNHHALVRGQLFVRNHKDVACYDIAAPAKTP